MIFEDDYDYTDEEHQYKVEKVYDEILNCYLYKEVRR